MFLRGKPVLAEGEGLGPFYLGAELPPCPHAPAHLPLPMRPSNLPQGEGGANQEAVPPPLLLSRCSLEPLTVSQEPLLSLGPALMEEAAPAPA